MLWLEQYLAYSIHHWEFLFLHHPLIASGIGFANPMKRAQGCAGCLLIMSEDRSDYVHEPAHLSGEDGLSDLAEPIMGIEQCVANMLHAQPYNEMNPELLILARYVRDLGETYRRLISIH